MVGTKPTLCPALKMFRRQARRDAASRNMGSCCIFCVEEEVNVRRKIGEKKGRKSISQDDVRRLEAKELYCACNASRHLKHTLARSFVTDTRLQR